MPGETPRPVRRTSRRGSLIDRSLRGHSRPRLAARSFALAELVVDELHDRCDDLAGAIALRLDRDLRALARDEHQHAHDALAVDLVAVLAERDVARELRRELDELGRRAR